MYTSIWYNKNLTYWILFVCTIKNGLKIHLALPGIHGISQFIVSEFDTVYFVYAILHCVNYQKMFNKMQSVQYGFSVKDTCIHVIT